MRRIRKLYYFDKKNAQEMISFLNNSANDTYINHIIFNPFIILHHFLPLKLKFLPESYILKEGKGTKGIITVTPNKSRRKKIEIQKLFFEENNYSEAAELVQYVVSKYKAMGSPSILVRVDEYLSELIQMFIVKCGFSQISSEKLWRVNKFPEEHYNPEEFRAFKITDAKAVATLYNESLLPHFRPLLRHEIREYYENIFKGLSYYSEYNYIIEDKNTRTITGYISIQTCDNENYLLDITLSKGISHNINSILHFASEQIKKRKKRFGLFIRTKHYTSIGESLESQFSQNKYECVQTQIVLTNSSAKVLKEGVSSSKHNVLENFYSGDAMPT